MLATKVKEGVPSEGSTFLVPIMDGSKCFSLVMFTASEPLDIVNVNTKK